MTDRGVFSRLPDRLGFRGRDVRVSLGGARGARFGESVVVPDPLIF